MYYFSRLLDASRHSWQGLKHLCKHEAAFQSELFLLPLAIIAAFVLSDQPLHIAIMIASYLLIMLVELLNTAIEAVVDRISPEHHPLSGLAKDLGSAAVLFAMLIAAVLWFSIIYQGQLTSDL